ncbi:unnamed protein product [Candidula unifasciata]|uniref:Uncharacterized protein n=1 Tax=Candidula unifasciata TaxID=100452 RepID=A0A8S3Z842_9EUPU|nr:unnamed protein product [Candidula unifasciata]
MGSPVVVASPRKSPLSGRRLNKPLVEKKRRARINGCLGQLKSLILSAVQSEQGSQVSRLEKADILEMTVKYLRHVQRHQASAVATSEPEVVAKFSAGYTECATEVIRYMDSVQCVAPEVRSRLEYHLVERLRGSVPNTVTSTTSGANSAGLAFTGMPTSTQTSVSDVCGRLVSSTNTSIPEQIHRHYQTAVDLANMAAAVTAKEAVNPAAGAETITVLNQSQSFHRAPHSVSELSLVGAVPPGVHAAFSMVIPQRAMAVNQMYQSREGYHSTSTDIIRSHSISPSHTQPREVPVPMVTSPSSTYHVSHIRHRSEPGLSQMAYSLTTSRSVSEEMNMCINNDANNNYGGDKLVQNSTGSSNINEYLSSFQRPLHIHIPDGGSSRPQKPAPSPPYIPDSPSPPAQQPTPSPPFLHPHVGYPHVSGQSHPITVASSTEYMPHTVLYGYTDYQTGVPRMYPAQYNTNTTDIHTRSSDIMYNDKSSRESASSNYIDNISRESANNIYNESIVRISTDRNMSQFLNNFSKNYADNISNYQSDFENHPSFPHGTRATPSPPTLLPEEAYVSDTSDQHYDNSYQDLSSQEYSPDFSANGDFRASFPAALSPNVKENYDPQSIRSNGQMNSNVQYRCNQYDQLSGYPRQRQSNLTTTSAMKQTSNFPTEQSTGNGLTDNGQDGMKGPCQAQTAPSRQNDQTLSPPTLKKRLLLAQGSAGEWTTPRYSGASEDKRQFRSDTGRVLSLEVSTDPRLGRDEHESQVHQESAATLPGAAFCALPVHAVPTDESLWRPW